MRLFLSICLFSFVSVLQAQNSDPNNDTGFHPYETYDGARENISVGSGNVFVSVPLLTLPGRNGHNYVLRLTSNSQAWSWAQTAGGWTSGGLGMVVTRTAAIYFRPTGSVSPAQDVYCAGGYALTDENGGVYSFPDIMSSCTYHGQPVPWYDVLSGRDSRLEGITADLNSSACKLTMRDGSWYPLLGPTPTCPAVGWVGGGHGTPTLTDTNGNMIVSNATPSGGGQVVGGGDLFPVGTDTDTLGRGITFVNNSDTTKTIQYRDSNGVQRTITLNVQTVPLSCIFGTPGPYGQPSGSPKLITSAVLPNGLTYVFQYDSCGNLVKIVYPSGGYTRYVLDYFHYLHEISSGTFTGALTDVEVTQKYVCRAPSVAPGATSTGTGNTCPVSEDLTTYTPTVNGYICNNSANAVVDPLGNKTAYQFTGYTYCGVSVLESQRQIYQGSSTLLRTVATTYTDIYPKNVTTILLNGLQSQIQYDYYGTFPSGLVKEKREYGWTSNGTYTLARKTAYANYCYLKPGSEIVYDGSSNQIAKTVYEFDNYSAGISSSGAVMHDSTYNSNFTTGRCNVTAIQRWRNTDGATLTTRMQYDDAGNVLSSTAPSNSPYDSLTRTTTYSYADSWGNNTCAPVSGSAAAYLTQTTDPAGLVAKHTYNSCTGTVASTTDPNNQVATSSYDLMDRLTQTSLPDGGQTSTCFSEVSGTSCSSSSYPIKIVSTQKITTTLSKASTTVLDGLSRVAQTQLNSDPDGVTYVDTTYDGAEQKSTVSNPYRSTNETTYGITTYQYDGLGRVTKVIPPDGSASSNYIATAYDILLSGTPPSNCTTVTDQTGKARKSCSDGLGRLTQVFEDPSGVNFETDYQYDLLNNLIRVDQKGTAPTDSSQWRTRTFAYNSLSQLLCAANPELAIVTCPNPDNGSYTAGTVRYAYDNVGNLFTKTSPRPNQPSGSVTVQTSFSYDADNRVLQKSYNDGATAAVKYGYDGIAPTGCSPAPPGLTDSFPAGRPHDGRPG